MPATSRAASLDFRLRIALALTISTFVILPFEWLYYRELLPVLGMLGVAAGYLPPIVVLRSDRPRLIAAVQLASAVLTCLSFGAFLLGTGGSRSVGYQAVLAIPLMLGLMSRETLLVPLVSGVAMGLIGVFLLHQDQRGLAEQLVVISAGPMLGVVAMYANTVYRRMHAAELAAVEERALMYRRSAEAERLASLGRLVADVAHEINNPLAFATSNVMFVSQSLAQQELGEARSEVDGALLETAEGLRRIQNIVTDLTALARPAANSDESCDVAASIETAVRIARVRAKGIATVEVATVPHAEPLAMNGARLVQVILNLLINSIDAIDGASQREKLGTVWIQLSQRKLVIEDDGPGFTPETQERLFEPFFTTKPRGKGTGLGLALCRQYLSEYGYSITADGRPGGGARFTVQFSAAGATPTTVS